MRRRRGAGWCWPKWSCWVVGSPCWFWCAVFPACALPHSGSETAEDRKSGMEMGGGFRIAQNQELQLTLVDKWATHFYTFSGSFGTSWALMRSRKTCSHSESHYLEVTFWTFCVICRYCQKWHRWAWLCRWLRLLLDDACAHGIYLKLLMLCLILLCQFEWSLEVTFWQGCFQIPLEVFFSILMENRLLCWSSK